MIIFKYILAVLSVIFCSVSWMVVRSAEIFSPNPRRLRGFFVDQSDLWNHLTKKKHNS